MEAWRFGHWKAQKEREFEAMQVGFSSFMSVLGYDRFYLLWLVVVVFDFRCASDYAMANNVFLVGMVFIRG
jgi:hypothetical protein